MGKGWEKGLLVLRYNTPMRFTWRLAGLFAGGMIFFLLSGLSEYFALAGVIFDVLLLAFVLADQLMTADPKNSWELTRELPDHFSLGASNKVVVIARFIGERVAMPHLVTIRDEPPLEFDVEGKTTQVLRFSGKSPREQKFVYALRPRSKGDFEFGNISLMYPGVFGLIAKAVTFKKPEAVKVYPNLHETEKFDLLARKGLLLQLGIKNIRQRGVGSEFESLREYVTGDEYRKIDWSATARRNKLITRQYEAERSQNIILAIDTGRNMLQPIQKMSKLDYVINTALMLAYVAASNDDKVGLFVFDAETRIFLPPAKSRGQLYRIMGALYNVSARMTESDYAAAFTDLSTRWRRRSLFVLFTDLIDADSSAGVLNSLTAVERLHRTVCVTVSDPNITASAALMPETGAEVYQKAVAMQALQERKQAINILKRRGVWSVDSPPTTLSADLINRYMELKARSAI